MNQHGSSAPIEDAGPSFWDTLTSWVGLGDEDDENAPGKGKGKGKGTRVADRRRSVWDSAKEAVGVHDGGTDRAGVHLLGRGTSDTVLVTGAEGFLGSHVVKTLLDRGYHVVAQVRSLRNAAKYAHLKTSNARVLAKDDAALRIIEADLGKPGSLDAAMDLVEFVVHVASPFRLGVRDAKVGLVSPAVAMTQNVLQSCAKKAHMRRLVVTGCHSSLCDKPAKGHLYTEEDWNSTSNLELYPYNKSKVQAEREAWDFMKAKQRHFDMVVLLPGMMIGPVLSRDMVGVSTSMKCLHDSFKGALPFVPKMGLSVVDVRDVAMAHVLALKQADANGRYIVTNEQTVSFKDLVEGLKRNLGHHSFPNKEKSKWTVRRNEIFLQNVSFRYLRPWLGRWPQLSSSRFHADFSMTMTPLDRTLMDTAKALANA